MVADGDFTPDRLKEFIEIADPAWIQGQLEKYEMFRRLQSPTILWSHRPPSMSPIIPIVYWAAKEPYQLTLEGPLGYWYGEPKSILGRFMAQLRDFRNYWESLPDDRGIHNIRWALRTPSRFASFEHELRTASTYKNKTSYDVEPRFFDPQSVRGEPDIILKKNERAFNVQCKSMDPSVSSTMPFELFNYLAGCLSRINQDRGIHGYLSISLDESRKASLSRKDIDTIVNQLRRSTESGPNTVGPLRFAGGEYTFTTRPAKERLPLNLADSFSIWSGGYLFRQRRTIPSKQSLYGKLATVCQVSGGKIPSFESYVYPKIEESAREAPKSAPLIISLHLYPHVPVHEYIRDRRIQNKVVPDLQEFFNRHRHVCLVLISSFAQQLFWLGGNLQTLGTPAWEIESQHWSGERPDYYPTAST